ncbi:transcription factor MYBS3-like [Miscanthus floridulus]|uniref:transcription factor MYBS3-like n=1 Tax=Miscanthus floridulus TaxID=154761 RepID=UPI0034597945
MTRRCSHCSHNGHNSRTCPNRGVKIFGVRLTDGSAIRKCASMGNLSLLSAGSTSGGASPADGPDLADGGGGGYASDDFVQGSSSASRERKKGVPWTEEEHRRFLLGLQKLGKGDWRGISRNFVVSRTPTQVASHAQKYFIRQSNMSRRKRRSSLFDMVPDESMDLPPLPGSQEPETSVLNQPPLPPPVEEEVESMESDTSAVAESSAASALMPESLQPTYPMIVPAYFSPFLQFSVPFWPNQEDGGDLPQETHEIVKPVAVHSKNPINVDELVGMSKLSIGEEPGQETVSTSLSLNLLGGQNRQSAFHANPTRAQA